MKIFKKCAPWIISIILASVIFTFLRTVIPFLLEPFATPNQNIEDMKEDFALNQKYIFIVKDFLVSSTFESISIRRGDDTDNKMFTGLETGMVPIDDAEILDALGTLFNNGYRGMSKRNDLVSFLRWAGLDTGIGLVYSVCGRTPAVPSDTDILSFLVHIEPFIIENWYFYIEDFNVWRSRYRN